MKHFTEAALSFYAETGEESMLEVLSVETPEEI